MTAAAVAVFPTDSRSAVAQVARLLIASFVLVVAAAGDRIDARLLALVLGYLVAITVGEVVRRGAPAGRRAWAAATVLVDVVFIAVAVAFTGRTDSPLLFLVLFHVMAVTLLVSARGGLVLAGAYAALLAAAHGAADGATLGSLVHDRNVAVGALALFMLAAAAAYCSSVNERVLRRSRAELEALVELGRELELATTEMDVARSLAYHVKVRLGFERAVAVLRQPDGWRGARDDGEPVATAAAIGSATAEAWETGQWVALRSAAADPAVAAVLPDGANVVAAPLTIDGETAGMVAAEWDTEQRGQLAVALLEVLVQASARAAQTVRSCRLRADAQRLATEDDLTGLANRRLFEEVIEREALLAEREAWPLSLIVFDVDAFKHVNDTHGHHAGDAVLRTVADALRDHTKGSDAAARYGGDEFVLLLPTCDGTEAAGVAQRLRLAVAEQLSDLGVTISAGVATMPDNAADADHLVAAADAALYVAKRAGRNLVARSRRESGVVAAQAPSMRSEAMERSSA